MSTATNPDLARTRAALLRQQITAAFLRPVWGIRSDARDAALSAVSALSTDAALASITAFWWMDDDEEDSGPAYEITESGVAIIPVKGVLLDSPTSWWMRYLGYGSTPEIADMVRDAAADANVTAILLHVDSPGGQASGVAMCADAVAEARQSSGKQVIAYCPEACSAAYWIASQAGRVYVPVDGITGCIGTLTVLSDWSEFYAQMGVRVDRITSDGAEEHKGQGAFGSALTDAQRADFKRVCNEFQSLFSAAVGEGRSLEPAAVAALADGRYHVGQNGVTLSLADDLTTYDDLLALLGSGAELYECPDPPPGGSDEPAGDDPPVTNLRSSVSGGRIPQLLAAFRNRSGITEKSAMLKFTKPQAAGNRNGDPTAATEELYALQTALAAAEAENEQLTAFRTDALAAFRADATAAAVQAFGAETPDYKDAAAAIASIESPSALRSLTQTYRRLTPAPIAEPTGARQTQGQEQNPTETTAAEKDAADKAEAEEWGKAGQSAARRLGLNANTGGVR